MKHGAPGNSVLKQQYRALNHNNGESLDTTYLETTIKRGETKKNNRGEADIKGEEKIER